MDEPSPWPDTLPPDMPSCFARSALMASRSLVRAYNAALREVGLPITQVSLMVAIRRHPTATLTSIAEGLALERTTLLRNMRQLETSGLVEPSSQRGRARHYRVTAAGEAALARAYPAWVRMQQTLQEALGPDSAETLAALSRLRRVAGALASPTDHVTAEDLP
mgnify:CR=1 FL=1